MQPGVYRCALPLLEKGAYSVNVTYDTLTLPACPYALCVVDGCDPHLVRVKCPPKCDLGEQVAVHIDTKRAGQGGITLFVEGPGEAHMECADDGDGTCRATFTPPLPGTYELRVMFAEKPVPGSPFMYLSFLFPLSLLLNYNPP